MIRKHSFLLLFLFLLLLPCTGLAGINTDDPPEAQAQALQKKYQSLTSLAFSFAQITRTGTRARQGKGNAVFYRYRLAPRKGRDAEKKTRSVMRWNYTEPDQQIIVSDGETLSIFTAKDKQLIKTPAKELESDITYAFFAGTRNLLDDFMVKQADPETSFSTAEELHSLMLIPRKPHNQIRDVRVWFDSEGIIRHMVIADHFDSMTELHFTDIRLNGLPPGNSETLDEIITFQVPPGTEIISR